jgi:hypothetical protein
MPLPRNIDGLLNSARIAISNALSSPKIQDYLTVTRKPRNLGTLLT